MNHDIIEELRGEAVDRGDLALVATCNRALRGDLEAIEAVAEIVGEPTHRRAA